MFAVLADPFPEPEAKGALAVRPVRADNVHDKKERDERVRCVGELEVARADEKHRHKKKNKEIFEKPRVPMERLPCRPEPHCGKERREEPLISGHDGNYRLAKREM